MKILLIHNEYAAVSGEEIEFHHAAEALTARTHDIRLYTRSGAEIEKKIFGKCQAFFAGIYNPFSRRQIIRLLRVFKPDVAFVQNLFPLISPAILPVIKRAGIPIIMCVANYRLMCPNGLYFSHGKVCERCLHHRAYWCLLRNCEEDIFKSAGYTFRFMVARFMGFYEKNIDAYICASEFLRNKMITAGFEAEKIHIIPNIVPDVGTAKMEVSLQIGSYAAYAGRISNEKGVHVLKIGRAHV
jgi:glycosyltransferase involved in cell wall biosynthesis